MREKLKAAPRWLGWVLLAAVVLTLFSAGVNNLSAQRSAQDLEQLEDALRRGAVAYYAAEGAYPQDLDVLRERYGLRVDEERYLVHYEIFASNLMPDIIVLEREP